MKRYMPGTIFAAKELRSHGYTYKEICSHLGEKIPKSTINGWVRSITPPDWYLAKIRNLSHEHLSRVRPLAQAKNRIILSSRLSSLRSKNIDLIKNIDRSVAKLILATLYWCEGAKYPSRSNIQFGNSDPGMIKIFLLLLRSCYAKDLSGNQLSKLPTEAFA